MAEINPSTVTPASVNPPSGMLTHTPGPTAWLPEEFRDLPTEDDLPYDDGEPMETYRHVCQMLLLIETLEHYWADRQDVFVGGNMFLYYSLKQVRNQDFLGPDFFAVQGVERRERKSWVMWQEEKGPDVIIELLSETTAERDWTKKKLIYQNKLRVPEYFLYDPFSYELTGYTLREGVYEPIQPDAAGRMVSQQLGLQLRSWEGEYLMVNARWLRWATLDGEMPLFGAEIGRQAQQVLQAAQAAQQEAQTARQETQAAQQAAQTAQQETQAAQQEAQAAQQEAQAAQQETQAAQQRTTELEETLRQYRESFGELKK